MKQPVRGLTHHHNLLSNLSQERVLKTYSSVLATLEETLQHVATQLETVAFGSFVVKWIPFCEPEAPVKSLMNFPSHRGVEKI